MTHTANRLRAVPRLAALCMAAFAALYVGLAASAALAVEPVKIARDDNALDLTATTEIYTHVLDDHLKALVLEHHPLAQNTLPRKG